MGQLYTIGCSILTLNDFVRRLKLNHINVVADVRSVPYSRTTPQFNREVLKERLRKVCKLSTWLIRFLNTTGIKEYSEEVNGFTYARYALLFIVQFIRKLHFIQSYAIPRNITPTTDKLYKMAFYKTDVYYSYLIAKQQENKITDDELKELFEHKIKFFQRGS